MQVSAGAKQVAAAVRRLRAVQVARSHPTGPQMARMILGLPNISAMRHPACPVSIQHSHWQRSQLCANIT